jgi:hypothetical protein
MPTAFDRLDRRLQQAIIRNLKIRKQRYLRAMQGEPTCSRVILLADTPGPARPSDPSYHHTPFYSTKHSSLWINCLLASADISDDDLLWFNTTLANGQPLDSKLLLAPLQKHTHVICLGGNAEKWVQKHAPKVHYLKVHHPQAWKRFHNGKAYPLLDLL